MKSAIKTAIVFSLILFVAQASNGQSLLDRVKRKANQKIEKRLEEKMDKAMDKQLDKVENSIDSLAGHNEKPGNYEENENMMQNRLNNMMKGIGMSGEPVPVEDNYSFTELVQMHIESFDNSESKTSGGEFITHLNPEAQSMAYEVLSSDIGDKEQGLFIIDSKNKAIILLNDEQGEKTGIVYGMGTLFEDIGDMAVEETEDDGEIPSNIFANPNVKKTGKTKSIVGYKCEQYIYNDEEAETEFWITDELKTSSADFFSTLFKTSVYTNGMGWGYVMESVSKEKATGDKTIMQVTKVDKNSTRNFKLSNYQITNLGSFKIPSVEE